MRSIQISKQPPTQRIQVGGQTIALPTGISVSDWALERQRHQNPCLRAYLSCIRQLDEVLESNYALLHCSPERLREIWSRVRQVAALMREELAPRLAARSIVPRLDRARQSADQALRMLDDGILRPLDRFPEALSVNQMLPVRKLMCVSIGQLHAFLQDSFGELLAADPRSTHDADYYLSKRFPRDIDEAEWLYATVDKLGTYLSSLSLLRPATSSSLRGDPARAGMRDFCREVIEGLTPRLKEVLALRGIRFHEMEILDRYAIDLPADCRIVLELVEVEQAIHAHDGDSLPARRVLVERIGARVDAVDERLRDLVSFVPLWLEGIEKRRALMLRRTHETDDRDDLLADLVV